MTGDIWHEWLRKSIRKPMSLELGRKQLLYFKKRYDEYFERGLIDNSKKTGRKIEGII